MSNELVSSMPSVFNITNSSHYINYTFASAASTAKTEFKTCTDNSQC